jgi:FlaA1/EpsC-like NDP-sugar epimerase
MEKLFQEACMWSNTNFTLVRYGNVLGSRGSVVPLFYKQIQEGLVTLTDATMTRFWLTLDDAVELVLEAMLVRDRGVIVAPKAPASDMMTLLHAVEGAVPSSRHWVNQNWTSLRKFNVKDIGIRPGEKLHECLVHRGEAAHTVEDASLDRFYIYPAYAGKQGNLPAGYEYTSDAAVQLEVQDLVGMIGCYP